MALPKLDTPIYELKIPSTGKEVSYRPFLVKEQKLLLMAMEDEEGTAQSDAIEQVISNCILDGEINPKILPLYDIEYIFLQLRSKSIGEQVELTYTCPNDKNRIKFMVDLSKIKVHFDKAHTNKIKLSKDVGVVLKDPTIDMLSEFGKLDTEDIKFDELISIMISCIDSIYDNESVHDPKDSTKEELEEFLSELSQAQFEEFQQFFETLPKAYKDVKIKCDKCDTTIEHRIEGMANFFQ
jgi:hypothetical protein